VIDFKHSLWLARIGWHEWNKYGGDQSRFTQPTLAQLSVISCWEAFNQFAIMALNESCPKLKLIHSLANSFRSNISCTKRPIRLSTQFVVLRGKPIRLSAQFVVLRGRQIRLSAQFVVLRDKFVYPRNSLYSEAGQFVYPRNSLYSVQGKEIRFFKKSDFSILRG